MALKKETKQVGLSTQIGVTRGRGLLNVSSAVNQNSKHMNRLLSEYAADGMAKEKKEAIEKGKKLGKSAEIIYEDIQYQDDLGNTVTTKIPKSYKSSQEIANNSWLALGYDETVLDTYFDATIASLDSILQEEKALLKSKVSYKNTIPEIYNSYQNNISQQVEAIRENLPKELKSLFDSRAKSMITSAQTELSNKWIRRQETYINAKIKETNDRGIDQLKIGGLVDYDGSKLLIDKLEDENKKAQLNGSINGSLFLEETLPDLKTTLKLSKFINDKKIFTLDFSNPQTNEIDKNNFQQLSLFLNTQGKSKGTLITTDGKKVELSLDKLGISNDEFIALAPQLETNIRSNIAMINSEIATYNDNKNINIMYSKSKQFKSSYFLDNKDIKNAATQLDNLDQPLWDEAIADYANSRKELNEVNADNMTQQQKIGFYQYYAGITGVIPESYRNRIESLVGSANDLEALRDLVNSPEWLMMSGTNVTTELPGGQKIIQNNLWKTAGLDNKVEEKAMRLSASIELSGVDRGVANFILAEQEIEKRLTGGRERASLVTDYAEQKGLTTAKLSSDIETKIKNKIPEKFIGQTIIGNKYFALIKADVMRSIELGSSESVSKLVVNSIAKTTKNGYFGNSKYSYVFGGRVASGATQYGSDLVFMKYPPDAVLQSDKQLQLVNDKINSRFRDLSKETDLGTVNPGLSPEYYSQENYEKTLEIGSNTKPGGPRYTTVPKEKDNFVLGENVFLNVVGNPANQANVLYQFVVLENTEDGSTAVPLEDMNGNIIRITYQDLYNARN